MKKGDYHMFNKHDISRDACQLEGGQASLGYDWWWHSFTAYHEKTGEAKPFFIEYFLCNPELGDVEPIFGQMPGHTPGEVRPSYLMVKGGAWGEDAAQLHRFFGWEKIRVDMGTPFCIEAEDCHADERHLKGEIKVTPQEAADHPEWMCDAGTMSWNLRVKKRVAFNVGYGAGKLFRKLQLFEMFWHAEGMKTAYQGEVIWNGERYLVKPETCYGYADKNWGKDFTSPWVWLSSNHLTSKRTGKVLKNSVFDIGGGCPKVGPIALQRKLLSAFWYEGTPYEFNFSKFWTFTRTKFDCQETEDEIRWYVEQRTWRNRMVTKIRCKKKDMIFINYESPNGLKRYTRLWNGGNGKGIVKLYRDGKIIDEIYCENVGCEYGEYDPL